MSQWPLIAVAMLGLVGVAGYCVRHDARHIQDDVLGRTMRSLNRSNVTIPTEGLQVNGRDVTLKGPRGSTIVSEGARDIAAKVWGVREPVHLIVTEPPPPVTPPPLSAEGQKLEADLTNYLAGKTIRFDANRDAIHADGHALLNEVSRILATAPAVAVEVTGHTHIDGDAPSNLELGKRRAEAVKRYLVGKGIRAERIETAGFSGAKPVEFHASSRGFHK